MNSEENAIFFEEALRQKLCNRNRYTDTNPSLSFDVFKSDLSNAKYLVDANRNARELRIFSVIYERRNFYSLSRIGRHRVL